MGEKVAMLVHRAALNRDIGPQHSQRRIQPRGAVDDDEFRRLQATFDKIVEERSPGCLAFAAHILDRQQVRASAAPEPWIAHSRAAPNSGTSWQSYPGLIRKPAPPRAGSSLRRRQTVEPLRKSPPQTSPAIPLRIRLRKGSASKVAGFYSATRDRAMPPLRGLLLHRRVHIRARPAI